MAGQRIDIMELRSLILFKLKGLSNRKVADYLKVNRKTVDSYTSRFKALELTYQELAELQESDLRDLFTETSQTEKERYETLSVSGLLSTYYDQMIRDLALLTKTELWKRQKECYRWYQNGVVAE